VIVTDWFRIVAEGVGIRIESSQNYAGDPKVSQLVTWQFDTEWNPSTVTVVTPNGGVAEFRYGQGAVEITGPTPRGPVTRRESLMHPRTMCLVQGVLHWPLVVEAWMAGRDGPESFAVVPEGRLVVGAKNRQADDGQGEYSRRLECTVGAAHSEPMSVRYSADGLVISYRFINSGIAAHLDTWEPC
jgi:hypothetical protein